MKLKSDYRISRESVADVVKERLLEAATGEISKVCLACPTSQQKNLFKRLTTGQKAIPLLQLLEGEVCNGGFHQFFWNSSGNNSSGILDALIAIQADQYSLIFQKAVAVLAVKGKLENRRQRQSALKLISKDAFDKLDDAFYELNDNKSTSLEKLRAKYFRKHPEDFFLAFGTPPLAVEVDVKDYKLPREKAKKLSDKNIHWLPIEQIWDAYWEAISKQRKLESPEKAEILLKKLTNGQRALLAVRVLNNIVLVAGWGNVVSNLALCVDVLHREIRSAYSLLDAHHYSELFERVVKLYNERSSDIEKLDIEIKNISQKRKQLNIRTGDSAFADDSPKFWELYEEKERLTSGLIQERQRWREEFIALTDSPTTRIERVVEIYVKLHPEEFFKD